MRDPRRGAGGGGGGPSSPSRRSKATARLTSSGSSSRSSPARASSLVESLSKKVAWVADQKVVRRRASLIEIRATLNPAHDLVEAVSKSVSGRRTTRLSATTRRRSRKALGDVFFETFLDIASARLLALDACPSSNPTKTLIWFVTPRDAKARLCVKLALAALEAEAQGWGLRLVHTDPEAAAAVVDALPSRCRGRVALQSTKGLADVILMKQKWGDDHPQFTRWDLSCLQASAVYYEGLEAPVVIAGGEDVLVRRPITDDELAYTMLGAPWRRTQIRFGGNGGFAVRDPAFVRAEGRGNQPVRRVVDGVDRRAIEKLASRGGRTAAQAEGILIDPRENLDAWANPPRG